MSKRHLADYLISAVERGKGYVYRTGLTVWYMVPRNAHTVELHMFSEDGSAAIVDGVRQCMEDARRRGYLRMEGRTAHKGFIALAKRCGWVLEGIRRKSHFNGTDYVDEYEMGVLLWDT
jgi:hypothetical protein